MHFGVAQRFAALIAGVRQMSLKLSAKAPAGLPRSVRGYAGLQRGMFSERGVVSCYVPRGDGEAFVEKGKGLQGRCLRGISREREKRQICEALHHKEREKAQLHKRQEPSSGQDLLLQGSRRPDR